MFVFLLLPKFLKKRLQRTLIKKWINYELVGDKTDPRWEPMPLGKALDLTLRETAIPHLLAWEDKNSMRWSIETRVPMLDHILVEKACSIPSSMKLGKGGTKLIFKKAVRDLLPEKIRARKDKIGFGTPDDEFFRNPEISDFCKKIIYSDSFKKRPYWNWKELEKAYSAFIKRKNGLGGEVMKWINLELWLRKYFPDINVKSGC